MTDNQHHDLTNGLLASSYGMLKWRLGPGGICEIVDITIKSEHRREGEGRYLLCLLMQEMAQPYYRVHTIYAFCRKSNLIAVEWYRACGFTLTEVPNLYGPGENGSAYCCVTPTC